MLPATTLKVVIGSSQCPSGPVGWRPPRVPDLGPSVFVELLSEHDVIGDDEPVDADAVVEARGVEHHRPALRRIGRERDERGRELRSRDSGQQT